MESSKKQIEYTAANEQELEMVAFYYKETIKWFNKATDRNENKLTPEKLDLIYPDIKRGTRWNSKYRDNAVLLLGSALGEIMVEQLGFKWVVIDDEIGKELSLLHEPTNSLAFPFSSVRKRIRKREKNYFTPLFQIHKERTEE